MQRKHTKYGPKFAKTDFFSGLLSFIGTINALNLRIERIVEMFEAILTPEIIHFNTGISANSDSFPVNAKIAAFISIWDKSIIVSRRLEFTASISSFVAV